MKHDTEKLCGKKTDRGFNMTTASGKVFWPADPRAEDVRIEDIAAHLSRLCRFNGALKDGHWKEITNPSLFGGTIRTAMWSDFEIYSVAQHSCLVCDNVETDNSQLKLAALLHDAAEAYVGDMIKPIKGLHPGRGDLEYNIDVAVAERFGLTVPLLEHRLIKQADYQAVLTEHRDLQDDDGSVDWGLDTAETGPWPERIIPVLPSKARQMFMERFNKYYKGE